MAYLTNEDIESRLGRDAFLQLTDDDGDNVADPPVVDEARLAAEGELDGYLAGRFRVPIDVTGQPRLAAFLASLALDLVEFRLRARRPPVAADALRRRQEALNFLTRVAEGRAELPSAAPLPPGELAGPRARASGAERVLHDEELSEF